MVLISQNLISVSVIDEICGKEREIMKKRLIFFTEEQTYLTK